MLEIESWLNTYHTQQVVCEILKAIEDPSMSIIAEGLLDPKDIDKELNYLQSVLTRET